MLTTRRILPYFAAAAVALPSLLAAQAPVLGTVKYNGDISANGTVGGFEVGPYKADLTGFNAQMGIAGNATLPNYAIWCVDWEHAPNNSADSYYSTAFSGNIGGLPGNGDFSKTLRYASNGNSSANAQRDYRQVAWLIEQYDLGTANFTATNVQGTIWELSNAAFTDVGYTNLTSLIPSAANLVLTKNWFVLSDQPGRHDPSHQEYIAYANRISTVPEPSTYLLMASGLAAIVAVSRRRRTLPVP